MNLNSLFPKQKELDKHIVKEKGLEGQNLLKKKTVALICELYECVNEIKMFKYWKQDSKPRTRALRMHDIGLSKIKNAEITNLESYVYNPMLEEYVDLLHFSLSIANDLGYHEHKYIHTDGTDLNDLVLGITNIATIIPQSREAHHISTLINNVIQLGYQLGFTEKDVLDAYDSKNEVNYNRQQNGY